MLSSLLNPKNKFSRLALLYISIIILIISVLILFVRLNTKSIDQYDEMSDVTAKKLTLLIEMRKNADFIQIQTMKHVLDTSMAGMHATEAKIITEHKRNDSIYALYQNTISDRQERELFAKLLTSRNVNKKSRDKLIEIDYVYGADLKEPIHYQQTVQQHAYEEYQQAITILSNYLTKETDIKGKEIDAFIVESRIGIYTCIIILLILIIILGKTIGVTLSKLRLQNDELLTNKNLVEEQKQFSESILTAAPDGIVGVNQAGNIVIFNKQSEFVFGYTAGEVLGLPLTILIPDQYKKGHQKFVEKYFIQPGDRPVSNRETLLYAQRKNGEIFPAEISLSFINQENNRVAIAGIKDITVRKSTEKRLQQLADINRFSKAFVGISTIDRKIIYINESFRNALGIQPDEDITSRNTYTVYPERIWDRMRAVFKEVLEKGLWTGESELLSADGSITPVAQTIVLHKDEAGNAEYTSSTMIDISELKNTEKKLLNLNRLHKALGDATKLLLNINTREKFYNEISEIIVAIGGLKLSWIGEYNADTKMVDPIGMGGEAKRYLDGIVIPVEIPKDKMGPTALAITQGVRQITNDFYATEITKQWQDKAKEFGLAASAVFPIKLGNNILGTLNVYSAEKNYFQADEIALLDEIATILSIGITKLEEEKVRKLAEYQKGQLSEIIEHTNAYISITDMDNHFVYMNKRGKEVLEISEGEDLNLINAFDILTPASQEQVVNTILPAFEKQDIWSGEIEMISRSGKLIPAMLVTVQHRDANGVVTHRSNTTIDITSLKQKEKDLQQLNDIIDNSNAFIGLADMNSKFMYLNKSVRKAFGISPDELIGDLKVFDFHTPSSTEKLVNIGNILMEKGVWTGETDMLSKTGKVIPTLQVVMLHKDKDGNPECYSTTAIDISEIKEKEKGLKQITEILEYSNAFVGIADLDSNLKYLNKSFRDALEILPEEDISTLQIYNFHTEASIKKWGDTIANSLKVKGFWTGETEILSRSGKVIYAYQVMMTHFDSQGNPEFISTTAIDISEIKEKEKEHKQLYEILEHSTSLVGIAKMDGTITFLNENFKNTLGIEEHEDIANIHLSEFSTANSKGLLPSTVQKVLEKGIWVGENEVRARDGSIKYLFQEIMLHYDSNGNPEYTSTTAIDISELKNKEKELQKLADDLRSLYNHMQSIKEEERKLIAKEIHDELGQNLTALKLNVAWISEHIDGDREKLQERLQLFEKVTGDTVTTSRRLYNNLYPQMLDEVGVVGAIRWLTNSYSSTTNIDFEFITNFDDTNEKVISPAVGLALYRIYQECLTNILRYSEANLVVISLQIEAQQIIMNIEDDGKGFEIGKVDTKLHHGLLGMRERAYALNGQLTIDSTLGKGTKTSVTIPLE